MSLLKGKEIEVSQDDQRRICLFARLHRRRKELTGAIARRKDEMEKLSDAADELMISDSTMYLFGETFIEIVNEEAEEWLEKDRAVLQSDQDAAVGELKSVEAALNELKASLYAALGNQVYLEDE